ncbi:MAG: hypothetical protein AB7S72_17140 [Draconibacterium sp.]|jgi:hypothetical protein
MKKRVVLPLFLMVFAFVTIAKAQDETGEKPMWNHYFEADFYFEDDFYVLPMYRADRNHLHLEARYNYEDFETFSAWGGYNLFGGDKLEYAFTPMAGLAFGNTNGLVTGAEMTFTLGSFELYNESEYLAGFESKEDNFFYAWTDFTYSPKDWLWFGLSSQITKEYQSDTEFRSGLILGGGYKNFELSGYYFEGWSGPAFLMFALSFSFPE